MRSSITIAAISAALGMTAVASAQESSSPLDLYPAGITIRAGVAIPLDPSLTNFASSLGDVGLEYTVPKSLLPGGDTYFALDMFFNAFGGTSPGTVMPITLNQRFYTSGGSYKRSYFFIGIGATYISVTDNGWAITARGGVGQELGPAIVAEIAGFISDSAGGARANAITFDIGYRF